MPAQPGQPSFFFTIFKKLQCIGHVQENQAHGQRPSWALNRGKTGWDLTPGGNGTANIVLYDATAIGTSPDALYQALTSGLMPQPPASAWAPGTTLAWQNFQTTPAALGGQASGNPSLLDTFSIWMANGSFYDTPTDAIATIPPSQPTPEASPPPNSAGQPPSSPFVSTPSLPLIQPLVPGASLFVCSMPNDNGVRPGTVPTNYWVTSPIFLTDQSTGNTLLGSASIPTVITTLMPGDEYNLVAVIGNNGTLDDGNYLDAPSNPAASNPAATGIEVAAVVMVWSTVFSPGVELPALSNLDVNDTNPVYEQYFLNSGTYDIVGFRLNVQTVFNGVVAALTQAVGVSGPDVPAVDLGMLTPEAWVTGQPAHLCVKVVIRQHGGAFPNYGDNPMMNPALAQKNLAPFDLSISDTQAAPTNIVWRNFLMGQPFFLERTGAGANWLSIDTDLNAEIFNFYLAITQDAWDRFFKAASGGGVIEGFRRLSPTEMATGKFGNRAKPFPNKVVLFWEGGENAVKIPAFPSALFIGMSLGIEYEVKTVRSGDLGTVSVVHRCVLPTAVEDSKNTVLRDVVAGGFTLQVRAK